MSATSENTQQDFLDGWNRAEQDDYIGHGKRRSFITPQSDEYLEGYYAFWAKQDDEIDAAERECIADYDASCTA